MRWKRCSQSGRPHGLSSREDINSKQRAKCYENGNYPFDKTQLICYCLVMETLNLASLAREYSDEAAARLKFEEMRWGADCKDVTCPQCGVVGQPNSYRVRSMRGSSTRPGLWRCRSCKGQFTVTKGT